MKDQDYEYEYAEPDNYYCYPGTNVLKNKLNISDLALLRQAERELSSARYAELERKGLDGDFSLSHLQAVHKYLFQDIYEWAGEIRKVDISKGTVFCLARYIEQQFSMLHSWLEKESYLTTIRDKQKYAAKLAYYLGELNMIHPFREGNGRTQRLFLELLCKKNGNFEVHFSKCTSAEMMDASIEASICNYEKMEMLIFKCLKQPHNQKNKP